MATKRKRPRLRTTQMHLRLTPDEFARTEARYEKFVKLHPRATKSDWVRMILLGDEPVK